MIKNLKNANIYSTIFSGIVSGLSLVFIFYIHDKNVFSHDQFMTFVIITALITIMIPAIIWVFGIDEMKYKLDSISLRSFIFPSSFYDLRILLRFVIYAIVTGMITFLLVKLLNLNVWYDALSTSRWNIKYQWILVSGKKCKLLQKGNLCPFK